MGKQSFRIDFKEDIESGMYNIETRLGNRVKILSWTDGTPEYPIIAVVDGTAFNYSNKGTVEAKHDIGDLNNLDLFVVSEPKLSTFERAVMEVIGKSMNGDYTYPTGDQKYTEMFYNDIRKVSAELQEKAFEGILAVTSGYTNEPKLEHRTQEKLEDLHYKNFCFFLDRFQDLDWVKKKHFPGLLEENNKDE